MTNDLRKFVATSLLVAMTAPGPMWAQQQLAVPGSRPAVRFAQSQPVASPAQVQAQPAGVLLPAQAAAPVRGKAATAVAAVQTEAAVSESHVFGPQRYVRTNGAKNEYRNVVSVPAWITSPYRLHVQNSNVASGTVRINGTDVLEEADFKTNATVYDRTVTLTPSTTLDVILASKPASFIIIDLYGTSADRTAPSLAIVAPAVTNDATPRLEVRYADAVGSGEPAASGVDTSTLQVFVDDVDRTELFTRRSDEASAELLEPLTEGIHAIRATIKDKAGNAAESTAQIRIDLTPPTIDVAEPARGSYLADLTPPVRITYADEIELELASVNISINGADRTEDFTVATTGATLTSPITLREGGNEIVARVRDLGGNESVTTASFNIDTQRPALTIVNPVAATTYGSPVIRVAVAHSDDQALDVATLKVAVDGTAVTTTPSEDGATSTGDSQTLADGAHKVTATIDDKAGNTTSVTTSFSVDTDLPVVELLEPLPGANIRNAQPRIAIAFRDTQGVKLDTRKFLINGTDQTSLFALTGETSPAVLAAGAVTLPEGINTITAEIADLGGNTGRTTSTFRVDVTAPTGEVVAPSVRTNSATPAARVRYADSGSGIDVTSVLLELDGADVTELFAITDEEATGTLAVTPVLDEGSHTLRATFRDRAGNTTTVSSTFIVDTIAPSGLFTAPENDTFVKTATPALRLTFADAGTGVDAAKAKVFLRKPDGTESDITARFTFKPAEANATIATATPLGEGTHRLRAIVPDLAGNAAEILASFEVDTVAPTYVLDTPAPGSFNATQTPPFVIRYADERSGLELTTFKVLLDGVDRTALFTIAEDEARAILPTPLSQGQHNVQVTLFDRAGNRGATQTLTFTIDTINPTAVVALPANGTFVATATPGLRFTYSDGTGSGIDPASVRVSVDGADVTATMTITATEATGTAAALADGEHVATVSALDWAGNSAGASGKFTVDTVIPVVAIDEPAEGDFTAANTIKVTGSVSDATAVTVKVGTVNATVTGTTFTAASVPLPTEGATALTATATDAAGNQNTASVTVKVDRTKPAVKITFPANGAFIQGATTEVKGTLTDASPALVTVNDAPALVNEGTFTASINGADGVVIVKATAIDAANNASTDTITITFDATAPAFDIEPTTPTNKATGRITGTINDISPVTLKIGDTAVPVSPAGAFSYDAPLTAEGANAFVLTATDAAGNVATENVSVVRDTTNPTLEVVSPTEALVIANLPVVVRGTASDATALEITVGGAEATITGEAWEASFEELTEGTHAFTVIATDAAGNTTTVTRNVTLDLAAPVVTITAPAAGTFTSQAAVTITGTVTDLTLRSISAGGVSGTFTTTTSGVYDYTIQNVPLAEGDNSIVVLATDAGSRTGQAALTITRDATPPVVTLTAPSQITRKRDGSATATVADDSAIASVTFRIGDTVLAELTESPYTISFAAPASAAIGSVFSLIAEARDAAGNAGLATQQVKVVSDGVLVGQVLDDTTGLPVAGARITVAGSEQPPVGSEQPFVGSEQPPVRSDVRGRYSLAAFDSPLTLRIEADDRTPVERVVDVASGAGTIPVDARLTPLSTRNTVNATGGSINRGNIRIVFPAGAFTETARLSLTPLSPQGLPNLLPLGWSPVAAFDIRGASSFAVPASATFSNMPNGTLHLVAYRTSLHSWVMVERGLNANSSGSVTVSIAAPDAHALVMLDSDVAITAPLAGEVLPGAELVPLPATTISSGNVTPAVLPPTGGSATGTISIQSPTPLPSGTVVQAHVSETYTLSSGENASEEPRPQDIVLYRFPAREGATVSAEIPIVPSRTFEDLVEGRVHLDILAGREGVRGKTGGNEAVTLADGNATLTVASGSLPEDTAVTVKQSAISSFVPSNSAFVPFAEVVVDFAGQTLATEAELSVDATGVAAGDTILVARVDRLGGIPRFIVVATAGIIGGRAVTRSHADLPGIVSEGRFVFYRTAQAVGFVKGVTASPTAGPVRAVVQASGVPFASIAGDSGQYVMPAIAGNVTLTATVQGTSLHGSASATVTANATATRDISLAGTATTATVTPANGATLVPVTTQIDITASAPFAASAAFANIRLVQDGGGAVATRLLLSASGRTLAVIPLSRLKAGTRYTLQVPNLVDAYSGLIAVPATSFTTRPDTPPQYDYERLSFAFPDADGIVRITAPAGTFPPGTVVLVVNAGNGVVVSYTALNDGSISGEIPASIDDRLLITITDPTGNVVNIERSKFIAPDGRTAIGPGGGTVDGPGGVQLRIPDGALTKGAVFRIEGFGPDAYPERPTLPNAHFGSGLRITSEQMPKLAKEGDLVFPKPADAPAGAFYYVYRRLTNSAGKAIFETIDHAFVEGDKVVTASYPFVGWNDSKVAWETMADTQAIGSGIGAQTAYYLMWTWDAMLPGLPTPGLVTGRVVRARFYPGQSEPVYEGIGGVGVITSDPEIALSFTNDDGRFALFDPNYRGGEIQVTTHDGRGNVKTVTAFQAAPDTDRDMAKAAHFYRNIAVATFAFDADQQLEVPKFDVMLMRMLPNGKREEVTGMVPTYTQLLIGFKRRPGSSTLQFTGANVNRKEFTVKPDYTTDPLKADFVLDQPFTPQEAREYVIRATALPVLGGAPVTESFTFLAIAGGGDNGRTLNDAEPDLINKMLLPRDGDTGVPTDVFVQIVFTEPVANPHSQIHLNDSEGEVALTYAGRAVTESGSYYTIADLRLAPADARVVSVTLQPKYGLRYADHYTLTMDGSIRDFDKNAQGVLEPKTLRDGSRTFSFDTMRPEALAQSASAISSPGLVILGNHAWVGERTTWRGYFSAFDIRDPARVTQIGNSRRTVTGQLIDIAGEEKNSLTGGPVVVVSGGLAFTTNSPSNLYLWDVSSPAAPERKAIVSLTQDAGDGVALELAVHGKYAYSLTYPKGVQVIDLQHAMKKYQDAANRMSNFVLDSVTAGTGVSQDSIVAAIQVRTPSGAMGHFVDLKVADMIVGGTNSQPVVVLAGSIPLAVVDPIAAQPLYRAASIAEPGVGSFTFGRDVALGTLGSKRVALLIGSGTGRNVQNGAIESGYVFGVFDMTNPASPKLVGTVKLDRAPTDVVLGDRKAVVAAEGVGLIIDLSDMTKPRVTGEIPNVSGNIALSTEGLLYSSDLAASAVKSAVYQPIAFIQPVEPVLVRPKDPATSLRTPSTQQTCPPCPPEDWVVNDQRGIELRVVPFVSGTSEAQVEVKQNGATYLTDTRAIPGGKGTTIIPDQKLIDRLKSLVVKFTVSTPFGELQSLEREIQVGWADVHVDLNNDTKIDTGDALLREERKRAWGFWEARQKDKSDPSAGETEAESMGLIRTDLSLLEDFAEIRIEIKQQARRFIAPEGRFYVRLKPEKATDQDTWGRPIHPVFTLSKKVGDGLKYLTDEETAKEQYRKVRSIKTNCSSNFDEWDSQCKSQDDGNVALPDLAAGTTYDFLFRCLTCRADARNPKQTKLLEVLYVEAPGRQPIVVDRVLADIRPIQQWMTMQNAREPEATDKFRPRKHEEWSTRDAEAEKDWQDDVPEGAKQVTVLVHGYNVPHHDAIGSFFPTWFRRLYWAGHRVMRRQAAKKYDDQTATDVNGCAGECAHTVVISWPSNQGGQTNGVVKNSEGNIATALVQYPEDEFHALQMGVPLAKYIAGVHSQLQQPDIFMMAHSLGNVAANSALSRPELAGDIVKKYIMNEAAMASEVFNRNYAPEPEELRIGTGLGSRHAERYGYSQNANELDARWTSEWNSVLGLPARVAWGLKVKSLENRDGLEEGFLAGGDFYSRRWRLNDGTRNWGDDEIDDGNKFARGDWRGVFDKNLTRTAVWNTWSENDLILKFAWRSLNRIAKPNPGGGFIKKIIAGGTEYFVQFTHLDGYAPVLDNIYTQRWLLGDWTKKEQFLIFGENDNGNWAAKRKMAELSQWFPAVSKAAGFQPVRDLPAGRNCNFSGYYSGLNVIETHSYMKMTDYHKVDTAWQTVKEIFSGEKDSCSQ